MSTSVTSNLPPPALRVLCNKLTSVQPTHLPTILPSLIKHVLQCKDAFSAPQDQKVKETSSETSRLVHKLKTNVKTLLSGRSREGRFAAIGLIKALVDIGGWEMLKDSGQWVPGLLSVVQKADPIASKELAVITLTKIYVLVHPYQTLVREVATKTLPEFISASLQLIKKPSSGDVPSTPLIVVETICEAFSTLVPLYPTTFRPNASQIRTATKNYLAPTTSDTILVPSSLQSVSRQLVISLHHTAAKSSGTEEWAKLVDSAVESFHSTADQVFRAVQESWQPLRRPPSSKVDFDSEPRSTDSPADEAFPPWAGIQAGTERLIGISQYLIQFLQGPTKASVAIPITGLMDTASRVCLIARSDPKKQSWDQALETNPAVGRDEKEELWSLLPEIHVVMLQLLLTLVQRLDQQQAVPLVTDLLDQLTRVFKSGISSPEVRKAAYDLLSAILAISGPNFSKPIVDSLDTFMKACCRDLQEQAGFLKQSDNPSSSSTGQKKNGITNADLFLKTQAASTESLPNLSSEHIESASNLLVHMLTYIPQKHLKPSHRSLLDKTSIVARNREAMFASVLNPYKDSRGRMYPSILPHLTQQFPQDQGLEILRSNLRNASVKEGEELEEAELDDEEEDDEATEDEQMDDNGAEDVEAAPLGTDLNETAGFVSSSKMDIDLPIQQPNPFESTSTSEPAQEHGKESVPAAPGSPPKRKLEYSDSDVAFKKQEREAIETRHKESLAAQVAEDQGEGDDESDDDDDESVHLNMELEDGSDTDAE